jgi:hypothetical protein
MALSFLDSLRSMLMASNLGNLLDVAGAALRSRFGFGVGHRSQLFLRLVALLLGQAAIAVPAARYMLVRLASDSFA